MRNSFCRISPFNLTRLSFQRDECSDGPSKWIILGLFWHAFATSSFVLLAAYVTEYINCFQKYLFVSALLISMRFAPPCGAVAELRVFAQWNILGVLLPILVIDTPLGSSLPTEPTLNVKTSTLLKGSSIQNEATSVLSRPAFVRFCC